MGPASSARAELDLSNAFILHFAEVKVFCFSGYPVASRPYFPLVSPELQLPPSAAIWKDQ